MKSLPHFLAEVDSYTESMTKEQLGYVIHEIARKLNEKDRESFLNLFNGKTEALSKYDDHQEIQEQIDQIIEELEVIHEGIAYLRTEYNNAYDEWYNNGVDEILFHDPQEIGTVITDAMNLVHTCVDHEYYQEGLRLCEYLTTLEVCTDGSYLNGTLDVYEMNEYDLLSCDFTVFAKDCLYLTYMATPLSERASALYLMFQRVGKRSITFETVLQMGHEELAEYDAFLPLWIEYLATKNDQYASILFMEAIGMIKTLDEMTKVARRNATTHPELYVTILNMEEDKIILENIGIEALKRIPSDLSIRAQIALMTAGFAAELKHVDIMEQCWMEAFRSCTNPVNYLRIRFLSRDYNRYEDEVNDIMQSEWKKSSQIQNTSGNRYLNKNQLDRNDYCTMLYFEQKSDEMISTGMSVDYDLGWSTTFMKQGIAMLLCMLDRNERYDKGMQKMMKLVLHATDLTNTALFEGTGITDDRSDEQIMKDLMNTWKQTVVLTEEMKKEYLKRLDGWIERRVKAIMSNNRSNYYDECAAFVAAYGEVLESFGLRSGKQITMMKYRQKYPRRSSFLAALDHYGLDRKFKG